ncbi:MAG: DMT family transporter [Alphaproteobacteria bacterium]
MSGAALPGRRPPEWSGVLAVALAAAVLGFSGISARFAYLGGANLAMLLAMRFVVMTVTLFLIARALGMTIRLPRALRLPVFGLGLIFALNAFGYVGFVAYIPVSLGVLLVYTYPLMVAALSRLLNRERFTPLKITAVLGAFVGVAVMLGVSWHGLDWRGVALALLAATANAAATMGAARAMRRIEMPVLVAYMSAVAAIAAIGFGLAGGGFAAPTGVAGWIGAAGVTLCFFFGFVGYFFAVRTIGETRSAVIANLEPAVGVLAAFALLGESFSLSQAFGALLLLGGVFLIVYANVRLARRTAPAS